MRNEEGDTLIFYQILSTCYFRKCIEIIVENLFVDIEAERVKSLTLRSFA